MAETQKKPGRKTKKAQGAEPKAAHSRPVSPINGQPVPNGPKFSSEYQPENRRGPSIIAALRRQLREDPSLEAELAKALVAHYREGNATAIKEVNARLDGPIPTQVEGDLGGISVNFICAVPDEDD